MNNKQLYTPLSRTKRFEFIHLNNSQINERYYPRKQPLLEFTNARFNSQFKIGKICKITIDDKIILGQHVKN